MRIGINCSRHYSITTTIPRMSTTAHPLSSTATNSNITLPQIDPATLDITLKRHEMRRGKKDKLPLKLLKCICATFDYFVYLRTCIEIAAKMTQGAFIMSWTERERRGTRPVGLLSTHCHLQLHCPSHPLQLAIAIVKLVKKNLTASKRIWQEESCAVPSVLCFLCCAVLCCALICVVFCELLEEFDFTIPHHTIVKKNLSTCKIVFTHLHGKYGR